MGRRKQKSFKDKGVKWSVSLDRNVAPSTLSGRYSFAFAFSLITIAVLLIYSNTFSFPFHFDDVPNIVENNRLREFSNFWPPSGTRYMGFLSFAINYSFDGLNVFGYRLVNIIIHIVNGLLIWWLIVLTFKLPIMENSDMPVLRQTDISQLIAITSALIFVSHPVLTQAVTYIVQRFTSLSTLFYLLSIVFYIKVLLLRIKVKDKFEESSVFSTSILTFYLLSLFSAVLAMKTKEISFTLPFIIMLYEFMFSGNFIKGYGQQIRTRVLYLIPFLLTLFIIPLSIAGTDKPAGDIIGELSEAMHETVDISRGVYLLTQFRVIVIYIRLLFLPINQNLDYDYPLSHSLFEPKTFSSFVFLLAIFIFAIYLFVRSRKTGSGYGLLASFGIFWFFVTLSVESSIIPIRDVIFEHRLYLPSVGFFIAFSTAVFNAIDYYLPVRFSLLLQFRWVL